MRAVRAGGDRCRPASGPQGLTALPVRVRLREEYCDAVSGPDGDLGGNPGDRDNRDDHADYMRTPSLRI